MHPLRHRVPIFAFALLALASCTVIPANEYASFKKSAAEARSLGESILLDYSASIATKKLLEAAISPPAAAGPALGVDALAFDVRKHAVSPGEDSIGVRLKAWQVLAQYIECLNALAEGRSADEIAPSVNGLLNSVAKFPVKEIAGAVSTAAPYVAVAVELLEQFEKERSRRKFVESVKKIAPLIQDFVEKLLIADAQDIYDVRRGIFDLQYGELTNRITSYSSRYLKLVQRHQEAAGVFSDGQKAMLKGLEDELKLMPRSAPTKLNPSATLPTPGAVPAPAETQSELGQILLHVKPIIAETRQLYQKMEAFRDTLITYTKILETLKLSVGTLREAVENNDRLALPAEELFHLVQTGRRAYALYKESR